ncbi:glycosyltransferase family 2 protein [Polynucleobacter paneuropaeus]|nr:glycosyltransferase family 2 protein [Polynucleobacter paneuropaeus]
MKIAVITPYFKEPIEFLRQCHESVKTQGVSADHFFIADGFPNEELISWGVKHATLPQAHADNGNTPRGIGSILADIEGYDFISYLDADNWFHPGHLESLLNLWNKTKANICSSLRTYHTLDGIKLDIREVADFSLEHIDTSCYLIHRSAFEVLDTWNKMPYQLSPICDRIFLAALRNKRFKFASTKNQTVAFRSQYKQHYLAAKITPPAQAKDNIEKESLAWMSTKEGMRETAKKLGFIPYF